MEKFIKPALVSNASTLGIHWIYDHKYLEALSKKQSLLFLLQDQKRYQEAENAYYSYPNQKLGDVTVQGEILKWLYKGLKQNNDLTELDYSKILYQQFKPGGSYYGYVESYSKKHVLSVLAKSLEVTIPESPIMDDHLVGFIPYLACKELSLDSKKAWELTRVYTKDEDYYIYFKMFDKVLATLTQLGLKKAIELAIPFGPEKYQIQLQKALEIKDPNAFIESYSGRACAIKFSIPLVIHILYHTNSYEEAIQYNALLGGAISDRNMLIGAIFAQVDKIPESWLKKLESSFTF